MKNYGMKMNQYLQSMKLNVEELGDKLVAKAPVIDGWEFAYEDSGFFCFSKDGANVYCTPNLNGDDDHFVYIQVIDADGELVGKGDDKVPYTKPLTVDLFIELMIPVLAKASIKTMWDDKYHG